MRVSVVIITYLGKGADLASYQTGCHALPIKMACCRQPGIIPPKCSHQLASPK